MTFVIAVHLDVFRVFPVEGKGDGNQGSLGIGNGRGLTVDRLADGQVNKGHFVRNRCSVEPRRLGGGWGHWRGLHGNRCRFSRGNIGTDERVQILYRCGLGRSLPRHHAGCGRDGDGIGNWDNGFPLRDKGYVCRPHGKLGVFAVIKLLEMCFLCVGHHFVHIVKFALPALELLVLRRRTVFTLGQEERGTRIVRFWFFLGIRRLAAARVKRYGVDDVRFTRVIFDGGDYAVLDRGGGGEHAAAFFKGKMDIKRKTPILPCRHIRDTHDSGCKGFDLNPKTHVRYGGEIGQDRIKPRLHSVIEPFVQFRLGGSGGLGCVPKVIGPAGIFRV